MKGKSTTLRYDPKTDGPDELKPYPPLPADNELLPHPLARLYLGVGLVMGKEPNKYKPTGISRNKARDMEREKRGMLRRDAHAVRAYIPITENIQAQAKFYVGCLPSGGRLYPRVIEAACVFFYPEF